MQNSEDQKVPGTKRPPLLVLYGYLFFSFLCIAWSLAALFSDISEQKMLFIGIAIVNISIYLSKKFDPKEANSHDKKYYQSSTYTKVLHLSTKVGIIIIFTTLIGILLLAYRLYIL